MSNQKGFALLAGACVGAGIMYFADPVSGKRRLSLARDQVVKANRKLGLAVSGCSEDMKNRLYGLYCVGKRSLLGDRCSSSSAEQAS
jgi:hypothetical protein